MLRKLWAAIKEIIRNMIGKQSVQSSLGVDFAISDIMAEKISLWANMYKNEAPWLTSTQKGLSLPAAISSDIARAVTIEMVLTVEGSPRADWLEAQIDPLMPKIRQWVEFGAAKGGFVLKPYTENGRGFITCIQADQFYPVRFNTAGELMAAVFIDQRHIGESYYTRLEYHDMKINSCMIYNKAFRASDSSTLGSEIPLTDVPDWADMSPATEVTNIDKPLFAYFRYPLANFIDSSSHLGVSCYSRAVDLIQQADEQWQNFLWEFESGQRALYVDQLAFGLNSDGEPVLPNKRLYQLLDAGGQDDALFKEWSPDLRQTDILEGLDAILKRVEFLCGLATGTLSNPQFIDRTATELKMSHQRTFATVVDSQKALDQTLKHAIYALDIWATLDNAAPKGEFQVTTQYDDSVVVDRDSQFQSHLRLVGEGIMSKVEWRMTNLNESREVAEAAVKEAMMETIKHENMLFEQSIQQQMQAQQQTDNKKSTDTKKEK